MARRSAGGCSSALLAGGFRRGQENFADFLEYVNQYWENAVQDEVLPEPSEEQDWKVWLVKPSSWFKHHSLVFESIDLGGSFTVELVVDMSTNTVTPMSRLFDRNEYSQLNYTHLGNVPSTTANSLFATALDCLEKFGDYSQVSNNCQDFCKQVAGKYGLDTGWTDTDKAIGTGLTLGAVGLGIAAIAAGLWWGSGSEKKDDKKK